MADVTRRPQGGIFLVLSAASSLTIGDGRNFVIASIEPFIRLQDMDGRTAAPIANNIQRDDDIQAQCYGLQLAIEIESLLTDSLSLIGRASAGAYYVDADIDSSIEFDKFPAVSVGDSDNTWGGRFGGALGIKVPLHYAGASLTLLGTIDYLTDVATIDHIDANFLRDPGQRTKADFDDALDVGGRVGLVFLLR
jgi:hypothetical protein